MCSQSQNIAQVCVCLVDKCEIFLQTYVCEKETHLIFILDCRGGFWKEISAGGGGGDNGGLSFLTYTNTMNFVCGHVLLPGATHTLPARHQSR